MYGIIMYILTLALKGTILTSFWITITSNHYFLFLLFVFLEVRRCGLDCYYQFTPRDLPCLFKLEYWIGIVGIWVQWRVYTRIYNIYIYIRSVFMEVFMSIMVCYCSKLMTILADCYVYLFSCRQVEEARTKLSELQRLIDLLKDMVCTCLL